MSTSARQLADQVLAQTKDPIYFAAEFLTQLARHGCVTEIIYGKSVVQQLHLELSSATDFVHCSCGAETTARLLDHRIVIRHAGGACEAFKRRLMRDTFLDAEDDYSWSNREPSRTDLSIPSTTAPPAVDDAQLRFSLIELK